MIDEEKICNDYNNYKAVNIIAKENHIGTIKVKNILLKHNIKIRDRHSPRIKRTFIIPDYHIKKYPNIEGYHYVAISKSDGTKYYDHENRGGFLTKYIREKFGITSTLYERNVHYQMTGNYWWEQWFDIILEKKSEVKKCPYCEWETEDINNRSGHFLKHLKEKHKLNIQEYLNEHPEDKKYFHKQHSQILKKEKLTDKSNYVICPICGEKFEKLSWTHLKYKHNLSVNEFYKKYPNYRIMSDNMIMQIKSIQLLGNLTISKKRFISKYEMEIRNMLDSYGIVYECNRQILIGKEIDILIPDKKIGIEFDGLLWHTEWFGKKPNNYHLNKTIECNKKGYGLIHIFEDEYEKSREIVLNKLKHILNIKENKSNVYGRICAIKEITKIEGKDFLKKYSIQDFANATIYLGAFFNSELIGVMTFKNGNKYKDRWNLVSFATDYHYNCIGVGGKLFKYFVNTHNPNYVFSLADRRWTIDINNNFYIKIGFKLDKINPPEYKYYDRHSRENRYKRFAKNFFTKKRMSEKYGFSKDMTETEMAKEIGLDRIWDCGLIKYIWTPNNI